MFFKRFSSFCDWKVHTSKHFHKVWKSYNTFFLGFISEAVSNDDAIWLKHNNEPWDQVCERWNNTFELRHKQQFQTVHEFLETWPILKDGKADTLVKHFSK